MADEEEISETIITGYRLIIQSAGEGWSDKTEIELGVDEDITPEVTVSNGVDWERYRVGPNDWVELRYDCIWSRAKETIEVPNPLYVRPAQEGPASEEFFRSPEFGDQAQQERRDDDDER